MRRITLWILSTISALVLLFSYQTSVPGRAATVVVAGAAPQSAATTSTEPGTTATGGSAADTAPVTVTGDTVQTRYGPVQVQVTVKDDQIDDVQVLQVPWSNPKDRQINGDAVPILVQETIGATTAQVDMVSGATFTSQAYRQSLQSALDQL